jgi:hypothetical protein
MVGKCGLDASGCGLEPVVGCCEYRNEDGEFLGI